MQQAPGLPKTRSGKIMRRILRKIAVNERDIGDVSTIADEGVLQTLYDLPGSDQSLNVVYSCMVGDGGVVQTLYDLRAQINH